MFQLGACEISPKSVDDGEVSGSAHYLNVCYLLTLVALSITALQDGNALCTTVNTGIRVLKTS